MAADGVTAASSMERYEKRGLSRSVIAAPFCTQVIRAGLLDHWPTNRGRTSSYSTARISTGVFVGT